MSNGEVCCLLGVCCPPGSDAQREALVHEIKKRHPHLSDKHAGERADTVLVAHDYFRDMSNLFDGV